VSPTAASRHLAANPAGAVPRSTAARPATARPVDRAGSSHLAAHASSNPLDVIGRQIPLPGPVPDWSKPIILALLVLALCLAVRSRMMVLRTRRLQSRQTALIEDLGVMQLALAPDVPVHLGRLDVSVAYRPAEGPAAGGDFYDVFNLDAGRVAVILGDVSGHGREALARAALTRFTLRAHLELGLVPRTALELAGRRPTGNEDEFATVVVGVYEATSGTLTYATAGHPPPIVLAPRAYRPVTVCASPPLGWGVPTGRRQTTVSLPVGATACFFSDGLPDARSLGEPLGRDRVVEILAALGPSARAPQLLERLRHVADEMPDDMAACLIQARAEARGSICLEEIELDARQLAGRKGERFLKACGVPRREIEPALRPARDIAGRFDAAVIRVALDDRGTAVTATPPHTTAETTPVRPATVSTAPSRAQTPALPELVGP
jgi:hypothetical protein